MKLLENIKINFRNSLKYRLPDLGKRSFKIKLIAIFALFALLILSFFFAENIENAIGLNKKYSLHQTSKSKISDSDLQVNYIDVGQGNSIYVKLPDGKVLLIDGGNVDYGNVIAEYLKNDGVTSIDYMIATHADADHIGGLNYILKEFEVKNIYRPFQIAGTGTNYENFVVYKDEDLANFYNEMLYTYGNNTKISRVTSNIYKTFITNIYSEYYIEDGNYYSSNVTVFYDGLVIEGDDYLIEFFAPLVRDEVYNLIDYSNTYGCATIGYGTDNSNDNSAIFLLKYFDFTFLFTGDASWSNNLSGEESSSGFGEIDFVNSLSDDEKYLFENISVFLLGHHGSSYSSGELLLSLINANFFVVSVATDNTYGHPASDTLTRVSYYKKYEDYLLMTKDLGTITFGVVDGELLFCSENLIDYEKLTISWYLLGTILYGFVVFVIFSIRSR